MTIHQIIKHAQINEKPLNFIDDDGNEFSVLDATMGFIEIKSKSDFVTLHDMEAEYGNQDVFSTVHGYDKDNMIKFKSIYHTAKFELNRIDKLKRLGCCDPIHGSSIYIGMLEYVMEKSFNDICTLSEKNKQLKV